MTAQKQTMRNIAIVEDAPMVAMHLKFVLENLGYTVCGLFKSGEDLLQFLAAPNLVDAILMDIMLEGQLDGIETAHEVKSKHNFPVIFLSALTDDKTLDRIKALNPHGHLTKPFNEEELQITLAKVVGN